MRNHIYTILLLILLPKLAVGQKQITNFENVKNRQAIQATYQAQVADRLIFSAFTPAHGTELWVSQGTKATTRLLKDITPGYLSSYCRDFTKSGDAVYFAVNENEIWKTDGTTAGTQRIVRSDSMVRISLVAQKLLVSFRNTFTQMTAFGWLDENGKTTFWDDKATFYTQSGGNLYYCPFDSSSKQWTLRVFDGAFHTLASGTGEPVSAMQVEQENGYEYISVDAGYAERLLVVASLDRKENPKSYPWKRGPAPTLLRDKAGALYLIEDGTYVPTDATLKVMKVVQGHRWEVLGDIKGSQIYTGTPTGSMSGPYHTSFVIEGDQIAFTSLYGFESIYASYLGVFNFKKNSKRVSDPLPKAVTTRTVEIEPVTNDVFDIVANRVKCTYNLPQKQADALQTIPGEHSKVKIGAVEYNFENNLYTSSGNVRTALLPNQAVYESQGLYQTQLNDKLIFLTWNGEKGISKLWANDGSTTTELLAFAGYADSWRLTSDSIRVGRHIVFSSYANDTIRLIKTDGTSSGSKVIYTYSGPGPAYVAQVRTNKRLAAFELIVDQKRHYLMTDLEKVWEIDASPFEYHDLVATDNDFYLIHSTSKNVMSHEVVYQMVEDKLKSLPLSKDGFDAVNPQVVNGRIYFGMRGSAGQWSDIGYVETNSETVKRLYTGPLSYLLARGDYLLVYTGTDMNVYKASNGKLLGELKAMNPTQAFSGPAVGFWGTRQAVFVQNDQVISQTFPQDIENLLEIPIGFLVKVKGAGNSYSWYLYNRSTQKISQIFKDKEVEYISAWPGEQLLFGQRGVVPHSIRWDAPRAKRVDFPDGYNVTSLLHGSLAILTKTSGFDGQYVYQITGDKAVEKYAIQGWHDVFFAGQNNFINAETTARGRELARIDADSLYHFPEIIRGAEGIDLHRVIRFKGSDYVVAFTLSKGLQVWKMDEKDLETSEDVTYTRPDLPGRGSYIPNDAVMNAYPNPVANVLNIDLREDGLIRVIDSKGMEILKSAAGKTHQLDVKSLPAGQYHIIYSGKSGNAVRKVVKY